MDAITFSCPHCQQPFEAAEELMGQVVECPSCGGDVELPPGEGATDTASTTRPAAPMARKKQFLVKGSQFRTKTNAPPQSVPPSAVEGSADPAAESSPEALLAAKTRKRKANLWGGAVLALMFGLLLIGVGMQNSNLRNATAGEPARMTLAELVRKGPGGSRYVELTHLSYGDNVWVEEKSGSWQGAWAFLFTEDDPRTPVAAAYLKDGGESMIRSAMEKDSLRGFVDKRRKFFESHTGRQLYRMHPHVTSRDAEYFVRVVTWRPSQRGISITYGFGTGLILVGLVLVVSAIRYGKSAPARRARFECRTS